MNKALAKEWLIKAWHNLSTAKLLYKVEHYTDIIAVDLHYACEKTMKSILAYQNKKIPKTHNLFEIHIETQETIDLKDNERLLEQISRYHIQESYPAFERNLPSRNEIKEVLEFTESLFERICDILSIEIKDVKK